MSATGFSYHLATLRRHAKVLTAAAVVGALTGAAWVVLEPTPLTSTALVLLPMPAVADTSNSDVPTQVRVAESANILQRAGESVDQSLSLRDVQRMVKVSAPTDQLLQIDATSPVADRAQDMSQAVADAYVNYVRDTAREVTAAALTDLNNRRDDLEAQIEQLQKEIAASAARQKETDPSTPDGRAEARLLGGLRLQQANLALQLDKVQDKIAAGTPLGSSATGTSVIQQATAATGPSLPLRLLALVPLLALCVTAVAGAFVLLKARQDTRVRLRDDIADAIGSPVLASVRSQPQRSVAAWSTLIASYKATPVDSWALRQVLRGLTPPKAQARVPGKVDHPGELTFVVLSDDEGGLALGPQLASFAAGLGILTSLVATTGHDRAPALWAALEKGSAGSPNLLLGDAAAGAEADLTISLVVVDRRRPSLAGTPGSEATVLAVSAGAATAQELARVAVAVDEAGRRITGIVVADPDRADPTTGRHTIDERSLWPTLPTRLTGLGAASSVDVTAQVRP